MSEREEERDWIDEHGDRLFERYADHPLLDEEGGYTMQARSERPPTPAPPFRQRIADAFRVLVGRARAVPLEDGPQRSEWSRPEPFDPRRTGGYEGPRNPKPPTAHQKPRPSPPDSNPETPEHP